MDFAFSAADEDCRDDLQRLLQPEQPAHRAERPATDDEFTPHPNSSFDACLAWHKRLHRGGWVGISWPVEYGGRGAALMEQIIYDEECFRARAPVLPGNSGIGMIGPGLIERGSEAHKRRFVPRILSADDIWCQGFSEPGAGSDLAGLVDPREDRGDHFVVNGQKVWTSVPTVATRASSSSAPIRRRPGTGASRASWWTCGRRASRSAPSSC